MVDTCTITRSGGSASQDEATGREVPAAASTVYAGKCRLQLEDVQAEHPEAGERVATVQRTVVSVPAAVTGVRPGDLVTVTASAIDPALVGQVLRVRDVAAKTYLTARRMTCERTT